MTAFLTGGSGFIGAHVARALLARGQRVRCLIRPGRSAAVLRELAVEPVEGDLRDLETIRRGMAGCELVFHCAADYRLYARDPSELYDTNVGGTRHVMRAAAECGERRVIYTGTVGTLRPSEDGRPVDEQAAAELEDLAGDYERSKLLAEREVGRWIGRGLPVVVVMPSAPVGEGDVKPTPTGQIIVDFLRGRMPAYVDTGLNLVDVRDVAAGHLLAADHGAPGGRYILGNQNLTLAELFGLLSDLSGQAAPRVKLPSWLPVALAYVEAPLVRLVGRSPRVPLEGARMARRRMFFDAGRAVRELGLPQSPVVEALGRAVDWFRAQGYVPEAATPAAAAPAGGP